MSFGRIVDSADALLRDWLEKRKPSINGRLPSERALAREFGLTHNATNRAMARLIADGLVERRGYKLFHTPRHHGKKAGFDFRCDLVINPKSFQMNGYLRVARELGIDLRVHTWRSEEESLSILRRISIQEAEAVVLEPPLVEAVELWQPAAEHLVRQGIPVVCMNHRAAGLSAVFNDSRHGLNLIFDHFLELRHEEIALLTLSPWVPAAAELLRQWHSLCHEHKLARSTKRIHLLEGMFVFPNDTKRLAARFSSEWRDVTALIAYVDNIYPVQQLLGELKAVGRSVPEQMSLAFVGDSRALQAAEPPVTATIIDNTLLQETAFLVATRAVRRKREFGLLPQPCEVRIEPHLALRASTAPNPSPRRRHANPAPLSAAPILPATRFPDREQDLEAIRLRPYNLTSKVPDTRFLPLDLGPHVNRPLNFRRGWLGDLPLGHLAPGRHRLHGVPFDILGGSRHSDCGAVVFQSAINTTGNARKLPASLRIEVCGKAAAVYFLHGCGYARHLNRFAVYSFHAGRKKLGETPLVSLGMPVPFSSTRTLKQAIASANIQDWWPDYLHYDFPGARVVPLLENENPDAARRHVFLYTLEWINPSPGSTITHITIQSNPEQSTTLGLLGVTVLKPPGR